MRIIEIDGAVYNMPDTYHGSYFPSSLWFLKQPKLTDRAFRLYFICWRLASDYARRLSFGAEEADIRLLFGCFPYDPSELAKDNLLNAGAVKAAMLELKRNDMVSDVSDDVQALWGERLMYIISFRNMHLFTGDDYKYAEIWNTVQGKGGFYTDLRHRDIVPLFDRTPDAADLAIYYTSADMTKTALELYGESVGGEFYGVCPYAPERIADRVAGVAVADITAAFERGIQAGDLLEVESDYSKGLLEKAGLPADTKLYINAVFCATNKILDDENITNEIDENAEGEQDNADGQDTGTD